MAETTPTERLLQSLITTGGSLAEAKLRSEGQQALGSAIRPVTRFPWGVALGAFFAGYLIAIVRRR